MAFYGKRLIFKIFGAVIFLIAFCAILMFGYTILVNPDSPVWLIYVILVMSAVGGGLATYALTTTVKTHIAQFLGVVSGILIGMEIITACQLTNFYAKLAGAILCGILGYFLSVKWDLLIKCFGTAVFGSYLIVRGVGIYAPGYPADM